MPIKSNNKSDASLKDWDRQVTRHRERQGRESRARRELDTAVVPQPWPLRRISPAVNSRCVHLFSLQRGRSSCGIATARKSHVWSAHRAGGSDAAGTESAAANHSNLRASSMARSIGSPAVSPCLCSRAGEILFNGVSRIMDSLHLHAGASGTRTLFDLGSGCGRLCVQVFLQFPNLDKVVGVEVKQWRQRQVEMRR